MLKKHLISTFVAALVVASVAEIHGATIKKERSQLQFIGQFQKPMSIADVETEGESSVQQTSFYFLSQNANGHASGESDCKAFLGDTASLLSIETAEELEAVANFLSSSDDTGSLYWMSGRFDPDSRKFLWGNGVEIGAFAPWDAGHPDTQVPVTRVAAYTVGGLKFRTQFQTVSNRYICELQVAAMRNSGSGLKFVGQYKSPQTRIGTDGVSVRANSFYFLSQNAAAFQTAENDCKAYLGDDATLLYIETQEELGNVTKFLASSDDTGSTYWVGGKYDTERSTFTWLNGAELGPWAPWDAGMPNTRTQLTRVSAYTVGSLKLRTQFNTVSNRYICELNADIPEEEPIPCYNDNDLVMVIDSSGSIGQAQYMVALEFTTRLAITWADSPNNRISVIIFSNRVEEIIGLGETLSVAEIRDRIYNAPYHAGGTSSHLGLDRGLQEFNNHQRSVPKNMVFLTDGASSSPSETVAAAGRVQTAGIRAFSVGIGTSLNQGELLAIAGNKPEHVFNTDGFSDLLKLLQPVSRKVCN